MEVKFKVGDRVKCIDKEGTFPYLFGKFGTIVEDAGGTFGVKFDDYVSGHSCDGNCEDGHGWYMAPFKLELANLETIVIYRKDNLVIALDKSTGKEAVARCNPVDTFDFYYGAKLAFSRLLGDEVKAEVPEPVKAPLNTRIVFTKGDDVFKTGHIYEIKNGKIEDLECYMTLPSMGEFYSIEDVKDYFTCTKKRTCKPCGWSTETLEFIEVVDD